MIAWLKRKTVTIESGRNEKWPHPAAEWMDLVSGFTELLSPLALW
jgi:hypothetical protein